jgi:hypothetical protein
MPSLTSLLQYFAQATALCFLVGFGVTLVRERPRPTVQRAITKGFSASTAPTGLTLVLCAFDLSLLQFLGEVNLYIALAGGIVLWTCVDDLFFQAHSK